MDGEEVISKKYAAASVATKLVTIPDDLELKADGMDATRVVFMVVDQAGNPLPYLTDAIEFELEGPGAIIGPRQTALIGGAIATWVRAAEEEGAITLRAERCGLRVRQLRSK